MYKGGRPLREHTKIVDEKSCVKVTLKENSKVLELAACVHLCSDVHFALGFKCMAGVCLIQMSTLSWSQNRKTECGSAVHPGRRNAPQLNTKF